MDTQTHRHSVALHREIPAYCTLKGQKDSYRELGINHIWVWDAQALREYIYNTIIYIISIYYNIEYRNKNLILEDKLIRINHFQPFLKLGGANTNLQMASMSCVLESFCVLSPVLSPVLPPMLSPRVTRHPAKLL